MRRLFLFLFSLASGCSVLPKLEEPIVQAQGIGLENQMDRLELLVQDVASAAGRDSIQTLNDPALMETVVRWNAAIAISLGGGSLVIVVAIRRWGYTQRNWVRKERGRGLIEHAARSGKSEK